MQWADIVAHNEECLFIQQALKRCNTTLLPHSYPRKLQWWLHMAQTHPRFPVHHTFSQSAVANPMADDAKHINFRNKQKYAQGPRSKKTPNPTYQIHQKIDTHSKITLGKKLAANMSYADQIGENAKVIAAKKHQTQHIKFIIFLYALKITLEK